ncbi:hypothetical protein T11_9897 [Trichinella zimbabwensis]|uniref:Uncharacterized protein n=1 Tax=Trichinella zimbabwensis TaxID=268475 RepID=A0A0V1HVH8_9BILA|nr:hypothetical protein T11_9897 [Trichinella zimbabwensis]
MISGNAAFTAYFIRDHARLFTASLNAKRTLSFQGSYNQGKKAIVVTLAILNIIELNEILELHQPEFPFTFSIQSRRIDSEFVQSERLIHDSEMSNKL